MPHTKKTYEEAWSSCCACCGIKSRKVDSKKQKCVVDETVELLIQRFAQVSYGRTIQSFPAGICDTCLRALNRCQKAEEKGEEVKPREAWSSFKLEMIRVPRTSAKCVDCPCPICRCVKFNPIGVGWP